METGGTVHRNLQQEQKKSILILITNSFAAINIIHSGLIKKLGAEYEVHIMSTMIRHAEISMIQKHFAIKLNLIHVNIPHEPAWLAGLRKIEKAFFAQHFDIVTQKLKLRQGKKWKWLMINIFLQFIDLMGFSKLILTLLRQSVIFLTSYSSKLKPLIPYHFRGAISSSPLDVRENQIVNFLGRHDVSAIAMIISWDNLTSKGVINANHDYTLVWNGFMKNEFTRFYPIFNLAKSKVIVTGIQRFDCYFQDKSELNDKKARATFNVQNEDRVILIATSALRHFPSQLEIIADVVQFAANEGNVHVIIRCHPADDVNIYNQLLNKNLVTIWHPKNRPADDSDRFYKWFPEMDFLDSLAQMLQICDVCIQFASTMKLDAAACGKPIISVAYDGNNPLPYHQSVRRLYDYAHQVPLNALELDELVVNKTQLFSALQAAFEDKSQANLVKIKPFIHFTEAKSVDFTAKIIAEWLT